MYILLLLMPRGLSMKLIEYNYIIICIYTYCYFDVQFTMKQVTVLTPQNMDLPHGSIEWPHTRTGARNWQVMVPLPLPLLVRCGALRRCRNKGFRSQRLQQRMAQTRTGARNWQELVPLPLPLPVRCGATTVRCGAEIKVSAANGCSREWPKRLQHCRCRCGAGEVSGVVSGVSV